MLPITSATLDTFCHVCMQDSKRMCALLDINQETNHLRIFRKICNFKTQSAYPNKICNSCTVRIQIFYEFQQRALCSSMVLKEILSERLSDNMIHNLQLFCRICLKKFRFKKPKTGYGETIFPNTIDDCIGIKMEKVVKGTYYDSCIYPKNICLRCQAKLQNFAEFKNIACESLNYLENIVETASDNKTLHQDKNLSQVSQLFLEIFAEQLPSLPSKESNPNQVDSDYNENINSTDEEIMPVEKYLLVASVKQNDKTNNKNIQKDLDKTKLNEKSLTKQLNNKNVIHINCLTKNVHKNNICDENNKKLRLEKTSQKTKKSFKCEECAKIFRNNLKYEAHINFEHKSTNKPYMCEYCQNSYSLYNSLIRHTKNIHTHVDSRKRPNEKDYICELCAKTFKRIYNLNDHIMAIHQGLRPYKCSQCDKTFSARKTLKVHELTHSDEKQFSCKFCNKTFRQATLLKYHIEQHITSPELLCPICKRARKSLEDLKIHLEEHQKKMRHLCTKCGKVFNKKSNMLAHIKRMHLKLKEIKLKTAK